MNEVEKMYENCNIKKIRYCEVEEECPFMFGHRCEDCDLKPKPEYYIYPPFTAEKQLEIVKQILFSTWWMNLKRLQFSEKFDEGLAQMINELWQDLTEEERKQIKEILSE